MNEIMNWLSQYHVRLGPILASAVVLVAAGVVILVLRRVLHHWLSGIQPRLQLPAGTVATATRIVVGLFWLVALLLILDIWGIGLAGVWTLLVSIAAVIGVGFLATWALVSNLTASVFLAVWRPFRVGDTVVLLPENIAGRVSDRNLMFTLLRESDESVVNVPNNLFFQKMFRVVSGGNHLP